MYYKHTHVEASQSLTVFWLLLCMWTTQAQINTNSVSYDPFQKLSNNYNSIY